MKLTVPAHTGLPLYGQFLAITDIVDVVLGNVSHRYLSCCEAFPPDWNLHPNYIALQEVLADNYAIAWRLPYWPDWPRLANLALGLIQYPPGLQRFFLIRAFFQHGQLWRALSTCKAADERAILAWSS